MSWLSRIKTLFKYTVQYACITHCTFEYVGDFVMCNGPSMEPTLFSKNVLLTERFSRLWRGYKPGDIIIAVSPLNADQYICKRIVAISGDRVMVQQPRPIDLETEPVRFYGSSSSSNTTTIGGVASDGTTNEGGATAKAMSTKLVTEYVPRNCVWIEGDNKTNSSDSRYYGALPLGLVKSRVVCRIWPFSGLQLF